MRNPALKDGPFHAVETCIQILNLVYSALKEVSLASDNVLDVKLRG